MENEITKSFKDLLKEAREILDRSDWDGRTYNQGAPRDEEYSSLIYRGMDIILRSFNKDSPFYEGLDKVTNDSKKSANSYYYAYVFGIIEGAYKAYINKEIVG